MPLDHIDAALAAGPGGSREWGICTECGMGRAGREEIPVLLDLHRQIVAAAGLSRPFRHLFGQSAARSSRPR